MDKVFILNLCILLNLLFLFIFVYCFFSTDDQTSNYFRIGWSDYFYFVSMPINTPFKYFSLCLFIFVLNITEIFLNDLASPIIQFSTYNPYKNNISDFSRNQLEIYSNLIFFIVTVKKFVQVVVILSQIDIAIISLISSQISAFLAIRFLLNNKTFQRQNYEIVQNNFPTYNSINESTRINL